MAVAPRLGAEIVSIDSAMVYRGMDIGTAKPSVLDRGQIRHHMIDIADPSESVTVAQFQALARESIADIVSRGSVPLLVGGSGLYFRAVVDPLTFPGTDPTIRSAIQSLGENGGPERLFERLLEVDPAAASRIEPSNVRRVVRALEVFELTGRPFSSYRSDWDSYESIYELEAVGLVAPRDELDERIGARVEAMIAEGLLDEVRALLAKGLRHSMTSVQALGYAQLLAVIEGDISLEQAVGEIKRRTRKFARRQMGWFRADPRIEWFESDPGGAAIRLLRGVG